MRCWGAARPLQEQWQNLRDFVDIVSSVSAGRSRPSELITCGMSSISDFTTTGDMCGSHRCVRPPELWRLHGFLKLLLPPAKVLTAKLLVEVLVDSVEAATFQTNIDVQSLAVQALHCIHPALVCSFRPWVKCSLLFAILFSQPFGHNRRRAHLLKGDGKTVSPCRSRRCGRRT